MLLVVDDLDDMRSAVIIQLLSIKKTHSFFLLFLEGRRVKGRQLCMVSESKGLHSDRVNSQVYYNGVCPFFERFKFDFAMAQGIIVSVIEDLHFSMRKIRIEEFQNDLSNRWLLMSLFNSKKMF